MTEEVTTTQLRATVKILDAAGDSARKECAPAQRDRIELRAFRVATGSKVGPPAARARAMSHAVAISCRGTRCTPALEACIRFWAARLDLAHGPLERCDVTIDLPHQPGHRRRKYHVGLTVAPREGAPTVIDRREIAGTHGDLFAAAHDAFTLAGRELAARHPRGHTGGHERCSPRNA